MNVVSLTGGGCFCAAQALALKDFERPEKVDVWAGTSAGGCVALAMAAGISASRITDFFFADSKNIFAGRAWRRIWHSLTAPVYDDAALNISLQALFAGRTAGHLHKPCLVTTHDLRYGVPEIIWTPDRPDVPLWKIARMTMSAHTFFAAHAGRADGGLFHNDPCLAAVVQIVDKRIALLSKINLFSLGSGANNVNRGCINPRWKAAWLKIILNDTIDGASVGEQRRMARVLVSGYGGRYDEFEFPYSDLDFDDPSVCEMIVRDWSLKTLAASDRMNRFFLEAA